MHAPQVHLVEDWVASLDNKVQRVIFTGLNR